MHHSSCVCLQTNETNVRMSVQTFVRLNEQTLIWIAPQDLDELANLPLLQPLDQQFRFCLVTMLDIHTTLSKAFFTSCGHGNITLPLIKQCILTLGPYILALINKSLNTGPCPSSWKLAHINPLLKMSHPTSPHDARPVALLPKLSKLTERIVQQQLMEFIEAKKLLSSRHDKKRVTAHKLSWSVFPRTSNGRLRNVWSRFWSFPTSLRPLIVYHIRHCWLNFKGWASQSCRWLGFIAICKAENRQFGLQEHNTAVTDP